MNGICSVCNKPKIVHLNQKSSKMICRSCNSKDPKNHEECYFCSFKKRVSTRTKDGKPICPRCYTEKCSVCGLKKIVAMCTQDGEPICRNCYAKDPNNHEECSSCGLKKIVVTRTKDGEPICRNCYRKQKRAKMATAL